ncbi:MAG TPA: class I SAM-dependent methyltransferase [Kofleriaceae bacterium]|nr:class I SAM-dependent methyltransferase [Kofleriaceae bacterium]
MSDPAVYGDTWAPIYDEVHTHLDPTAAVEVLAQLAGTGKALELGVGTGRVAIPLAARGVAVHGIEASQSMLDRMRAKPGGADIPVTLGDFTDVAIDGEYAVVYIVFSTLYGLPTQAAQVACLRNAAARLAPGGVFVFEGFVPDPTRFDANQRVQVNRIEPTRLDLLFTRHDPVQQRVVSQHVVAGPQGMQMFPVEVRYVWPSELDLMAQLAGMRLRERWSDWRRGPYTGSGGHVSIYERAA